MMDVSLFGGAGEIAGLVETNLTHSVDLHNTH